MNTKKVVSLLAIVIMLALTATAYAASTAFELWVSPDGVKTASAITWYKSGSVYYLFVPGNVSMDELRIGCTGADAITVDGQAIEAGASAAALMPGAHEVKAGKKAYQVQVLQGSPDIPALYITTQSGSLNSVHKKKDNKEAGTLRFVNAKGEVEYDGNLTHIKMRGNSSTTFAKKNYQIKLTDGANLCGMGKSRTWILTGNYRDKSLLRNQITLDMAEYAGLEYTPEHIPAEVYINNEYMGLYLFSEKVMIDDDRIDITDLEAETEALNDKDLSEYPLAGTKKATPGQFKAYEIPNNPADITGGYLIEFEAYSSRYKEEASSYHTTRKNTLVIKSPEFCSVEQMQYISSFMQSFENAIFAADGIDPDTGKHYTDLVDFDSLVAKYMVEEISKNYDGNNSSMFFYKPADSQSAVAFAGPVWDYDSSYGSYAQQHNARRVLTGSGLWIGNATGGKYWWPALYAQPDFYQAVTQNWKYAFRPAVQILLGADITPKGSLRSLEDYADAIRGSADMNVIRWPRNKNPSTVAQTGYTFDENIDFLKAFLTERLNYLDGLWGAEGN